MAKGNNQKIKIIKILEILSMYSDEENTISTTEIIKRLKDEGIDCARKALYDDIKTLNEYGYEVMQVRKKQNEYYVVDRKFDVPELKILIDAVGCANFITEKKSEELTLKLANLAGSYKGEVLSREVLNQNELKKTNEKIYYTIDAVEKAIHCGKKIEFKYFDTDIDGNRVYRKEGASYIINPVKLTISDNKYYLICYSDKHPELTSYRVDRMDNVVISEENKTHKPCENERNVKKYLNGLFGMLGGKKEKVDLKVKNNLKMTEVINDKFGKDKIIARREEEYFVIRAEVEVSPTFFAWLTIFGGDIEIAFPQEVKNEYVDFLHKNMELYI